MVEAMATGGICKSIFHVFILFYSLLFYFECRFNLDSFFCQDAVADAATEEGLAAEAAAAERGRRWQ